MVIMGKLHAVRVVNLIAVALNLLRVKNSVRIPKIHSRNSDRIHGDSPKLFQYDWYTDQIQENLKILAEVICKNLNSKWIFAALHELLTLLAWFGCIIIGGLLKYLCKEMLHVSLFFYAS